MIDNYPVASSFWIALFVSGISAPAILRLLAALKSRQTVSEHVKEHAHKQGTPTMGGIIILFGFLVAGFIVQPKAIVPLLIVAFFAVIGFVDDYLVPRMMSGKRGLGWKQKLLMQIIGTTLIARIGTNDWLIIAWVVFMVLFMSNAYNFSDGMDGLAGSLALLLAIGLAVLSFVSGIKSFTPSLMAALAGGLIPFLYFNAPPAKVFMGDVGALPIGALFGYTFVEIPVRAVNMHYGLFVLPLFVLGLVMVIELVPVPIQIASVKLRKKRVFPATPIHHAFQSAGWPETRVVWLFVLVQLLCLALALTWMMMLGGSLS
ncbi:MAG: hypothetical protein JST40_03715 [Armatimonadetes bacterium]|nr:hypothetical protein [Armatimonadota bacterium]